MASNGHLFVWKMLNIFNFSNSVILLFLVLFSLSGTNGPDQCDKCLEWKNKGETKCEYPYVKLECQSANFTIEYEAILLANLETKSKPGKRFKLGPPVKCTMNSAVKNGQCHRMNIRSGMDKGKVDFEKQIADGSFLDDFDNFLAFGLDLSSKNDKNENCLLIYDSNSGRNDTNAGSTTIKTDNSSISGGEVTSTSMSTQTLPRTMAFIGNLLMQVLEGFLLGGEIEEDWNKIEIEINWNDPIGDGIQRFLNFTADKNENKIYIKLPEYVESKEFPLNDLIKPGPFNLLVKRLKITGNADLEMNNIQLELVLNDENLGEFLLDRRKSRNLTVQIADNEPNKNGFVPNSILLKKIYLTPARLSDRKDGYGMMNGSQIIINAKIPKDAKEGFKIHIIYYNIRNLPLDVDECIYTSEEKCCCWIRMRIHCNLKENITKIDYMVVDSKNQKNNRWDGEIQLEENPFYVGMEFMMNITSLTKKIFHIQLQDKIKNKQSQYDFTTQISNVKRIEFQGEIIVIEEPKIVKKGDKTL